MNLKKLLQTLPLFFIISSSALAQIDMPEMPALDEGPPPSNRSIQITADYFRPESDLNLPETPGVATSQDSPREGDLFGLALTYGFNSRWFLDLSYISGESDASYSEDAAPIFLQNNVDFDEDWLEGRVRWLPDFMTLGSARGYLSAGFTSISIDTTYLTDFTSPGFNGQGVLTRTEAIDNMFATLGAGLGWAKRAGSVDWGWKVELSLLAGEQETDFANYDPIAGGITSTGSASESVVGVLGRTSAYASFPFKTKAGGGSFFVEAGARYYYWDTDAGSIDIWGPFAKAGISLRF